MRFIALEMENFRQYASKQKIDFSTNSKKNFTVINGSNGCGKTNLLGAINWCFYGEEGLEEDKYHETKRLEILNEDTFNSMKIGEKKEVYVRISLGEKESAEIILERKKIFKKSGEKGLDLIDENFKILKESSGGFEEEKNKQVLIKQILPKEVRGFFFFDGEKLDSFFKIGSGTNIKTAIFDVSQIELINRTISHTEKVSKNLEKGIKNVNPEINKKIEERDKYQERKEELEKQKKEHEKEINKTEKEVSGIEDYLRKNSKIDVSSSQKERDRLNQETKNILDKKNELNSKIKDLILDNYSTSSLKEAINFTIQEVEKLDKEKKLPPEIDPVYLEKLLKLNKCICGRCLDKNSSEFKKVYSLMDRNSYGDNASLLIEGRSVLKRLIEKNEENFGRIRELNIEKLNIEKREEEIKNRNKEIELYLKDIDEEEVSKKETKKKMLYEALMDQKKYLGFCERDINDLEEEIKILKKEIDDLREKSNQSGELITQIRMLNESQGILEKILHEIVEDVRNTIQIKTEEYFFSMIWNRESFEKVRIDEDYNLSVINNYGSECLHSLSSGQRQVLALSFMAALKEVSGFNAPVVIDTPLGRISGEARDNIARNLPEYLKNTQVTILVTDTEYTPSFRDKIKNRTGEEYSIELNKKRGTSKLIRK